MEPATLLLLEEQAASGIEPVLQAMLEGVICGLLLVPKSGVATAVITVTRKILGLGFFHPFVGYLST